MFYISIFLAYGNEVMNKKLLLVSVFPIIKSTNAIAVFIDENDQNFGYLVYVKNTHFLPLNMSTFENIKIGNSYNINLKKIKKIPKCIIDNNYNFIETYDFKDYFYQSEEIFLKKNIMKIKKDE